MIDIQGFAWVAVKEAIARDQAAKQAQKDGFLPDTRIKRALEEFEKEVDADDLIEQEKLLETAQDRFREIFGTPAKIKSLSPDDFFGLLRKIDRPGGNPPGLFAFGLHTPIYRGTRSYRRLEQDLPTFRQAVTMLLHSGGTHAQRLDRMWEIGSTVRTYITESFAIPSALLFLQDPDRFSGILHMPVKQEKLTAARVVPAVADDASQGERLVALERALKELPRKYGRNNWPPMAVPSFYFSKAFDRYCGEPMPPFPASLNALTQSLWKRGLHFPHETIANYLLALQTKRFAILTGVSGTGKTALAIEVARHFACGDRDHDISPEADTSDTRGGNYTVIPVRPDWTDNRGLLGYYNPLTSDYVPTPFLRLLLKARKELDWANRQGRDPSPFFVVLDEMNLARVEHYFSDFLSAMESGEPILLHDDPAVEWGGTGGQVAEDGEIAADTPVRGGRKVAIPKALRVPENVFFTGTVNVDETTYMFSPKVLDRAFTCELNDVDLEGYETGEYTGGSSALTLDSFDTLCSSSDGTPNQIDRQRREHRWRPGRRDWLDFCALLNGQFRDRLLELHTVLEEENRHFGYRTANEIARFVNLAHEQSSDGEAAAAAAFDLAILQKVLPKLHGTQQELEPLLLRLLSFAVEGPMTPGSSSRGTALEEWSVVNGLLRAKSAGDQNPDDDSTIEPADSPPRGAADPPLEREDKPALAPVPALPRTGGKTWRMLRRLEQRGFTSFIE